MILRAKKTVAAKSLTLTTGSRNHIPKPMRRHELPHRGHRCLGINLPFSRRNNINFATWMGG